MSADLFVWDPALGLHPRSDRFIEEVEQLASAQIPLEPSPLICEFVAALLLRYPDLTVTSDAATIWSAGPLLSYANGGSINLTMTMEVFVAGADLIVQTAHRFGLDVFDGNEVYVHDGDRIQPPMPG